MTAPRLIEGELSARGRRIVIVAARFNDFIVASLLKGAQAAWLERGGAAGDLTVVRVPGAFELPLVVRRLAGDKKKLDAVIALGAVIRGATPHFDYVAGEAAKGLASAAHGATVPVIFGVLTTETIEQAIERAGTKAGNKGWDAAVSAVEMVSLAAALDAAGL